MNSRSGNIWVSEEEFDRMEAEELAEDMKIPPLDEAILKLAALVRMNSGASDAAKSVLLHMWNPKWPIIELHLLDTENHTAAIKVLSERWVKDTALKELVPDIQDWARAAENE